MVKGEGAKIYHEHLSNLGNFICGKDCVIHSNVWIGDGVVMGDRVKVQGLAFIPPGVEIEDDVFVGPGVVFTNDPELKMDGSFIPTRTLVKRGARIGANATILAGVVIGENALIGMGSVIIKNVPDRTTWVGNPGRIID